MNNKNNITVLSSFASDKLFDKRGQFLREQKGGPAFFIQSALKKEKVAFDMPYSFTLEVEIIITPNEEFGKVTSKIKPKKIDWQLLNTPIILISTILNEFDLRKIGKYENQVFLDVQGYVRDGKDFGRKNYWNFNADSILCVKGTEEEISYLPKDFVKKQKQKMLLITLGSKGSILYSKNKMTRIKPLKIVKSVDTIGAGDSFFAYFAAKYLQSNNPKLSLKYATSKTVAFLSSKKSSRQPLLSMIL
jgi:hypothetical protein